jgi:hypothetical protein
MRTTMYLHSSKEDNQDIGEKLGLTGKALHNFKYALYEVEFDVEVDGENGNVEILAVNGFKLEKPSEN